MKKLKKKPLLSIIIPAYNEEKDIGEAIRSLKKQSYKNFEIIVVDDGSFDRTREIVRKFKDVRLLEQKHKGTGAARNSGASKAKGEILIFPDSDMEFDKDYLKYLIKPLIEKNIIGTEEEIQLASNLDNIWSRCQGKIVSDPEKKDRKIFRAIRKDKFLELGGFDSKYGHADDQTFLFKYGIKSQIAEKAACYHKNPDSLKEVFKQSRWIGSSIQKKWINISVLNLFIVVFLFLSFPFIIPFLSVRKSKKIKDWNILFPYMFIFMTARYFGTLNGYLKKIFWNETFR